MLSTRSTGVDRDEGHPPEEFGLAPPVERPSYASLPPWSGDPENGIMKARLQSSPSQAPSRTTARGVSRSSAYRAGPPLVTTFLWLGAAGGLFYACWTRNILLGQLAAVAVGLGGLLGLWRGGLRKIVMIPLYIVVAYAVVRMPASLGLPGVTGYLVAGAIGVVALIIGMTTVGRIRRNVVETRPMLHRLDRCVGLLIGAAEGALVPLAMSWAAVAVRPAAANMLGSRDSHVTSAQRSAAEIVVRIADDVGTLGVGELVAKTSPIDRVPALRDAIGQLNETGRIDIDQMDPETRQRLEELLKLLPGNEERDGVNQSKSSAEQRRAAYEKLRQQLDAGR